MLFILNILYLYIYKQVLSIFFNIKCVNDIQNLQFDYNKKSNELNDSTIISLLNDIKSKTNNENENPNNITLDTEITGFIKK